MKVDFSRTAILAMFGIQIVMMVCLYALLHRVGKLESGHQEDHHQEKQKYTFKKGE